MNLRERHNLLQENIKLKKEQSDLNKKFDRLMSSIEEKMTEMVDVLSEINTKPAIITTQKSIDSLHTKTKDDDIPMFIPTADTSDLKISVSDVKKKIRKTNLDDAASKLSQLQRKQ